MQNKYFAARTMMLLVISGMLISCGGGTASDSNSASVQLNETPTIQGTWQSNSCELDGDVSLTDGLVFNETEFTRSITSHLDTLDCSSASTMTVHLEGTLNISGETTNEAHHLDINYVKAQLTASEETISFLASQGTTLQDYATARGFPDINNISPNSIIESTKVYTIYMVTGDTLRFGINTPSLSGLEPALRHDTLDTDTYSRVIINNVLSNDSSDTAQPEVIGIAYDEGELESSYGLNGIFYRIVGDGAYMVLEDGTAILAVIAPADFDINTYHLEEDGEITTLQELGIARSELYPPLSAGYTLDFFGEVYIPGGGGTTFKSIRFSSNGYFERNTAGVFGDLNGTLATNSDSGGTYSISGNTIELRYNSGRIERTLFATDGSTTVILGQLRFTIP